MGPAVPCESCDLYLNCFYDILPATGVEEMVRPDEKLREIGAKLVVGSAS